MPNYGQLLEINELNCSNIKMIKQTLQKLWETTYEEIPSELLLFNSKRKDVIEYRFNNSDDESKKIVEKMFKRIVNITNS